MIHALLAVLPHMSGPRLLVAAAFALATAGFLSERGRS